MSELSVNTPGSGMAAPGGAALTTIPYQLLFLDLNGTLVGETDTISPRTLSALHRAQRLGCTPVLCTGRNRCNTLPVADQIGGLGYSIIYSGSVTFDWRDGRVLARTALPKVTAIQAIQVILKLGLAPVCEGFEEDDRWIATDPRFPLPPGYVTWNSDRLRYVDGIAEQLARDPIAVGAYGPPDVMRPLANVCRDTLGPSVSVIESVSRGYGCSSVEVYPEGVTKVSAAQRLAGSLGIPRERVLAIGDHVNDLDVIRWAGWGVCMGDGQLEAREGADYVTGNFADDGVAQAIGQFVLAPAGQPDAR